MKGARAAATLRRLLGREQWYERVGSMPTSNRHGLAVMAAVSGVASDVGVRYDTLGNEEGSVVTLGCGDKQLLEEFCQDLDAVDIGLEWVGPTRVSSPLVRDTQAADALAAAAARLAEAEAAQAAKPGAVRCLARRRHRTPRARRGQRDATNAGVAARTRCPRLRLRTSDDRPAAVLTRRRATSRPRCAPSRGGDSSLSVGASALMTPSRPGTELRTGLAGHDRTDTAVDQRRSRARFGYRDARNAA